MLDQNLDNPVTPTNVVDGAFFVRVTYQLFVTVIQPLFLFIFQQHCVIDMGDKILINHRSTGIILQFHE